MFNEFYNWELLGLVVCHRIAICGGNPWCFWVPKKRRKKAHTHTIERDTEWQSHRCYTFTYITQFTQRKDFLLYLSMSQCRPCLLNKLWSISHGDGLLLSKHYAKFIRTNSSFTQSPCYTHTHTGKERDRALTFFFLSWRKIPLA